jgi:hypothetical protein
LALCSSFLAPSASFSSLPLLLCCIHYPPLSPMALALVLVLSFYPSRSP